MLLLITSFLAGILTVFAPCVLILLPVIVGSSLATDSDKKVDRWKPYIISASLGISVLLFTLLLKASTLLIDVDPQVWMNVSGGIVILLGLSLLFPLTWAKMSARIGLESSSNTMLARFSKKSGVGGYILTGAALGPVFSACSPVYALILATVLPVNLALGLVYMTLYALGLSLALLAIALGGRRITKRLNWTAKPGGWFRRTLAILLIVVGLAVITGVDKKIQTWVLIHVPLNSTKLEEKLLPKNSSQPQKKETSKDSPLAMFNVDPYQAPDLQAIQSWINSEGESLDKLRGKVVLIDFWTYSCINCQRTQPYLNSWHDKYKDKGLVILGLHAPEFGFEKIPKNVQKAVKEAKIGYPVGLDNDFATWKAYKNQFWPAKYLIDKNGKVRYTHFGEGQYSETESAIHTLLKETGAKITESTSQDAESLNTRRDQTPETYLGYERGERFANSNQFKPDVTANYILGTALTTGQWGLAGSWQIGASESETKQDEAVIRINFSAKEVYLVMSSTSGKPASMKLNGQAVSASNQGGSDVDASGALRVSDARLYRLVRSSDFIKDGLLEIALPAGTTVNAFTFGS